MKRFVIFMVVLFWLGASFGQTVTAIGPCNSNETVNVCLNRLNPGGPTVLTSEQIAAVRAELEKKTAAQPTGLPALTLPTGSAKRDFLSLFAASVSNVTVNDAGNIYTLEWNIPVAIFGPDDKVKLQAVVNSDPTLDASLKTALEAHEGASVDTKDKDDITASASYAPVGVSIGRSIKPHKSFVQLLALTAYETDRPSNAALRAMDLKARELMTTNGKLTDKTFGEIADREQAIELAKLVADAAVGEAEARKKLVMSDERFGVNRFYALLGNQPQFYISALYHERSPEIGADEVSGRLTYEWSGINLNSFYRAAGDACDNRASVPCVNAFAAYVKEHGAEIDTAPRFSLSVDVAQVHANDIAVPKFDINLHSSSSRKVLASAAYSREFRRGSGEHDARFDASLSYEDVTGDATKDDRFVGSAIFTQKINDAFSLPIGIVYANHQQFLPKSDRQVGVHVGLVYKLKPTS